METASSAPIESATSVRPKPGWLLIVSAVLVIAQAVVWFSLGVAALFTGDAIAIYALWIFAGPALAIGSSQYNALVRSSAKSAKTTVFWLMLATMMWFIASLIGVLEATNERSTALRSLGISLVGIQLGIGAIANLRWRRLLTAMKTTEPPPIWQSFTLRDLFAFMTAIATAAAIVGAMLRNSIFD